MIRTSLMGLRATAPKRAVFSSFKRNSSHGAFPISETEEKFGGNLIGLVAITLGTIGAYSLVKSYEKKSGESLLGKTLVESIYNKDAAESEIKYRQGILDDANDKKLLMTTPARREFVTFTSNNIIRDGSPNSKTPGQLLDLEKVGPRRARTNAFQIPKSESEE